MPQRSAVLTLPEGLREELNARLVANGFGDYENLSAWLAGHGYHISKSALHRHGSALEADFAEAMGDVRRTTALARAWAAGDEDERGDLLDVAARMLQDALLRLTIALRRAEAAAAGDNPAESAKTLSQVTRALADLGRMSLGQKRWREEVRGRAAAAADSVDRIARKAGLSAESVAAIRAEIMGITG